ncbi:hypothetical protein LQU94_07560 [Peptoniphilus sp. KCTC 25270]|uniref:hypothetical protein n=1 Tax=Peptoniphilus sp. KCTC 25270 TaxID=2897414 RepID=UPI001E33F1F4|nr:hypothetical protein [Peptoniphilus sp. KCTC 25270]MCD1147968.1 hypothetical protein [Peptoniphilus sp. KCTC 25270]
MTFTCRLESEIRLPNSKVFRFLGEEEQTLLSAQQDLITEEIDSFLSDFTFLPFTLSVKDAQDNEFFSLHKKRSNFLRKLSYVLIYSGGRLEFKDGFRFEMPNLSLKWKGRTLDLIGEVRNSTFYLMDGEEKLGTFSGERTKKGKAYSISICDEAIPLEIYYACALILDNLYHDY